MRRSERGYYENVSSHHANLQSKPNLLGVSVFQEGVEHIDLLQLCGLVTRLQRGDKGVFRLHDRVVGGGFSASGSELLVNAPAHDILEGDLWPEDVDGPLSKCSLVVAVDYLETHMSGVF